MKITIALFMILSLFMGVTTISMQALNFMHTKYQVGHAYHKGLQASMYQDDRSTFEKAFRSIAPKSMSYEISLKDAHDYPRLRHYELKAKGKHYNLVFNEIMIEERVYE